MINENATRFVVVFDTADAKILEDVAPAMLESLGFTPERYFPRLGVAIVTGSGEGVASIASQKSSPDVPVEVFPETIYHAISEPEGDTAAATWGLAAIRALNTPYTGKGIKLAVLDTGFNSAHPDFTGRKVTTKSFVAGEDAEDGHGHGTHCIGTAAGPRVVEGGRGYGVAPEVEIFAGKVLGNQGTGSDTTILEGIDWALANGCQVISMSLGASVRTVHPPYVAAGKRALEQGAVIIAAAGNNAHRSSGDPGFVGAPANSPYVMAVGAVDQDMKVADFSAQAVTAEGGEVDIAAPGVEVYSSWIAPKNYNTINGTSMATPHVSGIAALIAEATGARGQELWDQLLAGAKALQLPKEDVGAGLVQAPSGTSSPSKSWVFTVADEQASNLDAVAEGLRGAGVTVTRTLPSLGMIYGTAPADVEGLAKLKGIASADVAVAHSINPPEAEIQ